MDSITYIARWSTVKLAILKEVSRILEEARTIANEVREGCGQTVHVVSMIPELGDWTKFRWYTGGSNPCLAVHSYLFSRFEDHFYGTIVEAEELLEILEAVHPCIPS